MWLFRFPCFENPYQMDLHESPVTSCLYFANCPHDLIPAFYSVGCRQKTTGYSEKVILIVIVIVIVNDNAHGTVIMTVPP